MTYHPARMRFGAFIAPFHPVEENPTLALVHNCASPEATRRSYDLFARFVAPRFQGSTAPRIASLDWYHENSLKFTGAIVEGMHKAVEDYKRNNS